MQDGLDPKYLEGLTEGERQAFLKGWEVGREFGKIERTSPLSTLQERTKYFEVTHANLLAKGISEAEAKLLGLCFTNATFGLFALLSELSNSGAGDLPEGKFEELQKDLAATLVGTYLEHLRAQAAEET